MNTGWRVLIDDEPMTDFTRVPQEGQHVYMKLVPEGDTENTGIGMKIGGALAVIGGIVAIATLGWTGLGGAVGAMLIGSGVGLFAGGMVLYNMDIPSVDNKNRETPEQDPSIRGSRNQMRPYGVVPTLFGRRRIYADLAAKSHTWVDPADGSIYLYQLFCAGQKDIEIETDSIKIDETLLKDYSNSRDSNTVLAGEDPLIDMRIHHGEMPELFRQCFHETQVNAVLKHETDEGLDGSVIRTTPNGTEELNVDVFFYNGLGKYNDKGELVDASVTVGAWYKEADEPDSEYKPLGVFSPEKTERVTHEAVFSADLPDDKKITVANLWEVFGTWTRVSGDEFSVDASVKDKYRITIVYSEPYTTCGSTIYAVTFSCFYEEIRTISAENSFTAHELRTKRYAVHLKGLKPASYTVKLSRMTEDSTDSKVIDALYVGSIRAIKNEQPVSSERARQLTLVELRIKASEKLQNVVDQINFIARSKIPVPGANGVWHYALSSNPASAAMYAMQADIAQQRLSDAEIDLAAFKRLYDWCAEHKYECNAYLTEPMAISNLLSAIASTCRAEILRMDGKVTVIQDIARDSYVQLFSPRNSHDYKEHILLGEIPDEIKLMFDDADSGFAENSCPVYNTPDGSYAGDPMVSQDVKLWGVTNYKQAQKLGMYKYAVSKHRAIAHTFSVDFEYLMCRKGDWILYAGDVALAGIKQGRITERILDVVSGNMTGFECDESIPMESGKNYAVRIRKSSGEIVLLDVQNSGESTHSVMLVEAISAEDAPKSGDLFAFGERGNEAVDLIVTDIQCGENLSADLTCVEYAPEIFGVDEEGFVLPDFESKLSETQGATDTGEVSEWRTWTTYHDGKNTPDTPTGDGTLGGWHRVQTAESKWISTKTAATIHDGKWSSPQPTGQMVMEQVLGNETEVGNPDTVTGLSAVAHQNGISVTWNPVSSDGLKNAVKQYTVEISKDNGTTWAKLSDVYDSSLAYTFTRTGEGADGYPEKEALLLWKFRVTTENVYGKKSAASAAVNTDTSGYLTWIPQKPTAIITAEETGLRLLLAAPDMTRLYGTFWFYVTITDGLGSSYNFTVHDLDSTLECYGNHFFERADFAAFTVTVWGCNEAHNAERGLADRSKSTYEGSKINASVYKGWKPANPAVAFSGQGRHLAVAISNEERYGEIVTEVQISKDGKTWYAPDLTSDPYASADNWKGGQDKAFSVLGTSFYQKLPLETDTASATVKDTAYYYRLRTVNATAQKQSDGYASFTFVAQGTGAQDVVKNAINTANIVDGAITALKIYVESLAAITANLGLITNGTLKGNATNMWDLDTGEFRVGNNAGDYFQCIPYKKSDNSVAYNISFKASKFELTAIGTVIRGAFYVCPTTATVNADGVPSSYYFCVTDSGVTFNKNVTVNGSVTATGNVSTGGNITAGASLQGRGLKKTWTTLDLSALDESLWYPVTFFLGFGAFTEVECYVALDSGTNPSWSTHPSGFTCHLHLLTIGSGWGTTSSQTVVLDHQHSFSSIDPTGWTQMGYSSTGVLWLRGGGKYYAWNSENAVFTIRTSTYTMYSQSVSPTSSAQWEFSRSTVYANLNGSADTVDGYHADPAADSLIRAFRDRDPGRAHNGYTSGMTNFNADGSNKWWHFLSMDWAGNDLSNWISQLFLPTQDGGVPMYRHNNYSGQHIDNATIHKFITSENIAQQSVSHANNAGFAAHAERVDTLSNKLSFQDGILYITI